MSDVITLNGVRPPFVRTPYNYDMMDVSNATGLKCEDESLADQSQAEQADINTIVRRFGLTGELPSDLNMPQSGDFTGLPDFHAAMNIVRQSQEEFLKVPADVRARFGNDPQAFMNFIDDDFNRPEAERMGLLKPPVAPQEPLSVRVVDPVAPSGA